MVMRTGDATLRFGAGDEAESIPRWVERIDGMPSNPQPVYSLESEDAFMGAVAWEGNGPARGILSFYREWLDGEGFEISSEHRLHGEGGDEGALWARNRDSGRIVFLATAEEDGMTQVLLGYGERSH